MANFGNYSSQREDGKKSRRYLFEGLAGAPGVLSRPATEANERYNSARLKRLGKRTAQGRKKQRINLNTVQQAREEDALMLARFCVTGWAPDHAPIQEDGSSPEFNEQNAREFFLAIPPSHFDDFRAWVSDPDSFTDDDEEDDDDLIGLEGEDTPGE